MTGQGLVDYAKTKVGTPYFYGSKIQYGELTEQFMNTMHKQYPSIVTAAYIAKAKKKGQVGKVNVDCSGLIYGYTKKCLGSSQLYSAGTRLAMSTYKSWANGVVVWRKGHVGVFSNEGGKYYVYEAKGIDYGTVKSAFDASKWSYGLTFSWMDYDYSEKVTATKKGSNPYTEPKTTLKMGTKGEYVKWLQWELVESGYEVSIDGEFGTATKSAVKKFQASCKLTVDGIVGAKTIKALKAED